MMNRNNNAYNWINRLGLAERAERDTRLRTYVRPVRILWQTAGNVSNSSALLTQKEKQIALNPNCTCNMEGSGPVAILLDFGIELHGGIELAIQGIEHADFATLRIRFGESASEAMSELYGDNASSNDHARRDMVVDVSGLSMNSIGETGFRFVRIDLLSTGVLLKISSIQAVMLWRDEPVSGSFECSDPLLNRIWEVGAYTALLTMQNLIWDGVKRDRLVWVGDLHPEIATISTVFGDCEIIRNSLDFVLANTPDECWMNDLPSYSMWWIIIQHDYYIRFGNKGYLSAQLPHLRKLCGMLSRCISDEGYDITPEKRFLDWPTQSDKNATDLGLQALHVIAMRCALRIFSFFQDDEMAAICSQNLRRLLQPKMPLTSAKQANALAALAGIIDPEVAYSESLRTEGARGISAFTGFYVLSALSRAGEVSCALQIVRDYWGGMIKLGATTFWEEFNVDWMKNAAPIDRLPQPGEIDVHGRYGDYCYRGYRRSLCHGWSSAVTYWLMSNVLGIEVLEPGCAKVRVSPRLCGLKWARGSFPTPRGMIYMEHCMDKNGQIHSKVDLPEGILLQSI